MSEKDRELQNPENWDIDQAIVRPGAQKARAVVSVAFSREDFELVTYAAQQLDEKTAEFIRGAALEKASTMTRVTHFGWGGVSTNNAVVFSGSFTGTSTVSKPEVRELESNA